MVRYREGSFVRSLNLTRQILRGQQVVGGKRLGGLVLVRSQGHRDKEKKDHAFSMPTLFEIEDDAGETDGR